MPTTACVYNSGTKTWGAGNCTVAGSAIKSGDKLLANTRIIGDWSVSGTVTLPSGTYWITDGNLTVKNATLTCSGCTIIMTTATNTKIGYVETSSQWTS